MYSNDFRINEFERPAHVPPCDLEQAIIIQLTKRIRARRVVSRSNCRVTGKHPGFKSGRMHYWESHIEHDAFKLLDADPTVREFREQPGLIDFAFAGGRQRHYPDLLVEYHSGRLAFIEVKSDEEADSLEVQERTRTLQPLLERHGYEYQLMRASEIRTGYRLINSEFLLRYGRHPVPPLHQELFRQAFEDNAALPWSFITSDRFGSMALPDACHLILTGWLNFDWDSELGPETPITRGEPS